MIKVIISTIASGSKTTYQARATINDYLYYGTSEDYRIIALESLNDELKPLSIDLFNSEFIVIHE